MHITNICFRPGSDNLSRENTLSSFFLFFLYHKFKHFLTILNHIANDFMQILHNIRW